MIPESTGAERVDSSESTSVEEQQKERWTFVTAYDYHDEVGDLAFRRERYRLTTPDGVFIRKVINYVHPARTREEAEEAARTRRLRRNWRGDWIKGTPENAHRYLYRLPQLLAAKENGDDIWWVEGEKDADTAAEVFEQLGIAATSTSCHGGAGALYKSQVDWFRGHNGSVVIVADRDYAGAFDAILKLGALVRDAGIPRDHIRLYGAKAGKDFTDHIEAGYGLDDFVALQEDQLRNLAKKYTPATAAASGYRWFGSFNLAEWTFSCQSCTERER